MLNTIYVYPTESGLPVLAKQYNVSEDKCRAVNNSIDLLSFLSKEAQTVVAVADLFSADFMVIYPGRLTPSKKFEKVAAFCGALKKVSGKQVKAIFCDFPSQEIDSYLYKLLTKAKSLHFGPLPYV